VQHLCANFCTTFFCNFFLQNVLSNIVLNNLVLKLCCKATFFVLFALCAENFSLEVEIPNHVSEMALNNQHPKFELIRDKVSPTHYTLFLKNSSPCFIVITPEDRLTEYGTHTVHVPFGGGFLGENPIHLGFADYRTHVFSYGNFDTFDQKKCGYYIRSSKICDDGRANVRIVEETGDDGQRAWVHLTETLLLPSGAAIELLRDFTSSFGVSISDDGLIMTTLFDEENQRFWTLPWDDV